jgi:hypothetical protein
LKGGEKMNLLVISNHPPEKWEDEQKKGWDKIDYIPFPNVPASWDMKQVIDLATSLCEKIGEWLNENPDGKVCLQGDFSLCWVIYRSIDDLVFVFPTTERVVEERKTEDGRIEKLYHFRFVRWR